MSGRRERRSDELAVTAARMFKEDGMSYRQIGAQLGLTKEQAKARVWAGLETSPQLARKLKE